MYLVIKYGGMNQKKKGIDKEGPLGQSTFVG